MRTIAVHINKFILAILLFLFTSCQKEEVAPLQPVDQFQTKNGSGIGTALGPPKWWPEGVPYFLPDLPHPSDWYNKELMLEWVGEFIGGEAQELCCSWSNSAMQNLDWTANLTQCPCYIYQRDDLGGPPPDEIVPFPFEDFYPADEHEDPDNHPFHPGAKWCLRSKEKAGDPGQQCCYDETGKLITWGRGAGTPDKYSPVEEPQIPEWLWERIKDWPLIDQIPNQKFIPALQHFIFDVLPYYICVYADGDNGSGGLHRYLMMRPPNEGKDCDDNMVPQEGLDIWACQVDG